MLSGLEVYLVEPESPLFRLWRFDGGAWDPPAEKWRNLRVDPPLGHKGEFANLYLGDNLPHVAAECHILTVDHENKMRWSEALASEYKVARYRMTRPSVFIELEGPNLKKLSLDGPAVAYASNVYGMFQNAALALHQKYASAVHGLTWRSYHRNHPGRVYSLWHSRKSDVGLELDPAHHGLLRDDTEWKNFLLDHSHIKPLGTP